MRLQLLAYCLLDVLGSFLNVKILAVHTYFCGSTKPKIVFFARTESDRLPSFVVPPDIIPGRMALLVTLFLVLVNIFNTVTTNTPKAEGAMNTTKSHYFNFP